MAIHDFDEDGYAPPHPDEPATDDYTQHEAAPWVAIPFPGDHPWLDGPANAHRDGRWFILPAYDVERLPLAVIDRSDDGHPPSRVRAGHNAAHIVACVNALAGRDPKLLEALVEVGLRYGRGEAREIDVFIALAAFLGEGDES